MKFRSPALLFALATWFGGCISPAMAAGAMSLPSVSKQVSQARNGDAKALNALIAEAESGNVDAQVAVADLYGYGQGVKTDYAKALYWSRKAASHGNAEAEFNLGTAYAAGLSVPVDYVKACALMNLAVLQDSKYEKFRRNLMSSEMTHEQVAQAQELSKQMLRVGVLEALDANTRK